MWHIYFAFMPVSISNILSNFPISWWVPNGLMWCLIKKGNVLDKFYDSGGLGWSFAFTWNAHTHTQPTHVDISAHLLFDEMRGIMRNDGRHRTWLRPDTWMASLCQKTTLWWSITMHQQSTHALIIGFPKTHGFQTVVASIHKCQHYSSFMMDRIVKKIIH